MKKMSIISMAAASIILMMSVQACMFVKIDDNALDSSDVEISVNGKPVKGEGGSSASISGKGPDVVRTFDLSQCRSITVNGAADMDIRHGNKSSLSIEISENLAQYIVVDEDPDGNVTIELDSANKYRNSDMEISLTVPVIENLTINGAGDLSIEDMALLDFYAEINGAGDIELENVAGGNLRFVVNGAGDVESELLDCTSIKVEINGAGSIDLSGKAGSARLVIDGVGSIDVRELICDDKNIVKDGLVTVSR